MFMMIAKFKENWREIKRGFWHFFSNSQINLLLPFEIPLKLTLEKWIFQYEKHINISGLESGQMHLLFIWNNEIAEIVNFFFFSKWEQK